MVLYLQLFLIEILHEFLFASMRATGPAYLILLDLIDLTKHGKECKKMKFLSKQISPAPCYFLRCQIKYSLSHLALKQSSSMKTVVFQVVRRIPYPFRESNCCHPACSQSLYR
jgi:hypothetical protein